MAVRTPRSGVGSGSWTTSTRSCWTASRPSCRSSNDPTPRSPRRSAATRRRCSSASPRCASRRSSARSPRSSTRAGSATAACSWRRARPSERQDAAAAVFSSHPGVSHNYLREHELNLWFTLTVSPRSQLGLDRTVELLGELAEVEVIRPMPALRFFKIGVDLDVKGDRDPAAKLVKAQAAARPAPPPESLTDRDLDAIRALQRDLPAEPEPFGELAAQAGFTDGGAARARPRVPRDRADAPLRRRARASQRRLRAERHGRLARARGAPRRVRPGDGRVPRRLALLPAPDLSRLAVQPVLDDPRAHEGRLRGRARRDRRRDRARRLHRAVLHQGVQEDARLLLHARGSGVGAGARPARRSEERARQPAGSGSSSASRSS